MTASEPDPAPAPAQSRRRQIWRAVLAALVLAVLIAGGWWATARLAEPEPAGPTEAGVTVCQRQVAIVFPDDAGLRAHEQQLRRHPRVSVVALETQQQVLDWYRALLIRTGPSTAPLAKLVRVEAMPARAWLAAASKDLDQISADLHAQLGAATEAVWVTNPCDDQTVSISTTPSPSPSLSR